MRQQHTKHNVTSVRRHSSSQRVQTWGTMTTEYQERFRPPRCYKAIVTTSMQKSPYHQLKGTNVDIPTFRSYYVPQKWMKNPPKPPKPDVFQAWKGKTAQPCKPRDGLRVNLGLVPTDSASKDGHPNKESAQGEANPKSPQQVQEPQPFESITSYKTDYVTHPVQPRTHGEKPVCRTNKGLPLEPVVSTKPKMPWDINPELFDEATEFLKQFKTWSIHSKFHGHGKAKESSSPDDQDMYLSTTHLHYTAHQCQRTKPILPYVQTSEKSNEPFQAATTMKDDYKAWDSSRRLPIIPKGHLQCPKKPSFPLCTFCQAESSKTTPKPFSLHPNLNESMGCNSTCNTTQKNPGDICEEPSESHQINSCMVSGRN